MKTVQVNNKLTLEEREVILTYDSVDKVWIMDSSVPKYFRKALKQGWTPIKQYVYEDGTVCGMVLAAPEKSVSVRNVTKKQMTEKQLRNLDELQKR